MHSEFPEFEGSDDSAIGFSGFSDAFTDAHLLRNDTASSSDDSQDVVSFPSSLLGPLDETEDICDAEDIPMDLLPGAGEGIDFDSLAPLPSAPPPASPSLAEEDAMDIDDEPPSSVASEDMDVEDGASLDSILASNELVNAGKPRIKSQAELERDRAVALYDALERIRAPPLSSSPSSQRARAVGARVVIDLINEDPARERLRSAIQVILPAFPYPRIIKAFRDAGFVVGDDGLIDVMQPLMRAEILSICAWAEGKHVDIACLRHRGSGAITEGFIGLRVLAIWGIDRNTPLASKVQDALLNVTCSLL